MEDRTRTAEHAPTSESAATHITPDHNECGSEKGQQVKKRKILNGAGEDMVEQVSPLEDIVPAGECWRHAVRVFQLASHRAETADSKTQWLWKPSAGLDF